MRCKPLPQSLLLGVGVLAILSATGLYFGLLLRRGELRFSSSHLSLGRAGSIGIIRGHVSLWKFSQWSEENNLTTDQQQGSDLRVHEKSRSELVPTSVTHHQEEGDERRLAMNLVSLNEADVSKETVGAKTNDETATSQTERKLILSKISPGKEVHLNKSAGSHHFTIRPPFSLPVPLATLPLSQILRTHWLQALRNFLDSLNPHSGPVTIVTSDYSYREVLLNWLISAHVRVDRPLSNVLVLSLDASPSIHPVKGQGGCMHPHSTSVTAKLSTDCRTHRTHWFHTITGFEANSDEVCEPLGIWCCTLWHRCNYSEESRVAVLQTVWWQRYYWYIRALSSADHARVGDSYLYWSGNVQELNTHR